MHKYMFVSSLGYTVIIIAVHPSHWIFIEVSQTVRKFKDILEIRVSVEPGDTEPGWPLTF